MGFQNDTEVMWRLLSGQAELCDDGFVLSSGVRPACLVGQTATDDFGLSGKLCIERGTASVRWGLADWESDGAPSWCLSFTGDGGELTFGAESYGRFRGMPGRSTTFCVDALGEWVRVQVNGTLLTDSLAYGSGGGVLGLTVTDGRVQLSGVRVRCRRPDAIETQERIIPVADLTRRGGVQSVDLLIVRFGQGSIGYLHHAPSILKEGGISCELAGFGDPKANVLAELAELVTAYEPRVVILECFAEPEDVGPALAREFPAVRFISFCHSDIQTMPFERSAHNQTVLAELLTRAQAAHALPNYAIGVGRRQQATLLEAILDAECVCIPHPVSHRIATAARELSDGELGISLFGKHRVMKNIHAQAAAVAYFQHATGRDTVFYYNAPHGEADSGLLALLSATGLESRAVKWLNVSEFLDFCTDHIDIGLQCSLSETFNYTALDQMAVGIPVICSPAIEYADRDCQVSDFTDYLQLAEKIEEVTGDYERFSRMALETVKATKERQNHDFLEALRAEIER